MSTPSAALSGTDTHVFWSANEGGGWMHLLPPTAGKRLLCIDPAGAAAWMLAREAREVVRLHAPPTWPELAQVEAGRALASISLASLLEGATAFGFEPFDGIVAHDPRGSSLHRGALPLLRALLEAADRLLSPDGFVYLGLRNAGSLQAWRQRLGRSSAEPSAPLPRHEVQALMRLLRPTRVRSWPCLVDQGRVVEVLTDRGYRATKNRERLAERAKERLYGRRGAPLFAPVKALLALRGESAGPALDVLVQRTGVLRAAAGDPPPVLKQCLVFSGHKAIVSAGPPGRDDRDVVAVLAGDALSIRGRSIEAPQLDALSRIPSVSARVPRRLDEFAFGQARCFVLERIPGVTLDVPVPPLERVTDGALAFLLQLHRDTARSTSLDEAGYEHHVEPLLQAALRRNPDFEATLARADIRLRASLAGRSWPTVFQHGDCKIENVIYEPGSGRVLSVIDWEHARPRGLPLLDLHYLLVYNRIVRCAHWTDAIDELVVRQQWSRADEARLRRYRAELQLDPALEPALRLLFLVHHVGCRIHLHRDPPLRAKVGAMLANLVEGLPPR